MTSVTTTATTTASSAATTTTGVCSANLYDTPVQDVACAMPYNDNYVKLMKSCCKTADVVSYYNDCGVYCLAVGQTVDELTKCLFDGGAKYQDVFCRGNTTATATGTGAGSPASTADTRVLSTAGSSSNNSSDNNKDNKDNKSSDDNSGAVKPHLGLTTLGLSLGALVFSAAAFGLQL